MGLKYKIHDHQTIVVKTAKYIHCLSVALRAYLPLVLYLFLAMSFCSCRSHAARIILIRPFGDFPSSQAKEVYREIAEICPGTVLRASLPLPAKAYYQARSRYRADSLIRILGAVSGTDTVIIGLTDKDISTTKDSIADWGVMGLGYCPGNACMVSTFRLSKANKANQFYKVAIHELGHTQGLPHCKNKTCFMRDAEGGNPLNEETGFCADCKAYLLNKGWILH